MLLPMAALWMMAGAVMVAFLVKCGIIAARMEKFLDCLASAAREVN